MDSRHLVRFDTDRIKDYVFATDRLREVRGADAVTLCGKRGVVRRQILTEAPGRW